MQIDHANAVSVGVGDVQLAVGKTQTAWLAEKGTRLPAFRVVDLEGRGRALHRVDHLDLAVIGIGHVQPILVKSHAQGVLQTDLSAYAVHVAEVEKSMADNGSDPAHSAQGHSPNGTHLAVRHEQSRAISGQAVGWAKQDDSRGPSSMFS